MKTPVTLIRLAVGRSAHSVRHRLSIALGFSSIAILAMLIIGCESAHKDAKSSSPNSTSKPSGEWSERMQELSQSLTQLLPLVADHRAFNDPAKADLVQNSMSQLKAMAHQVKKGSKPSSDPAFTPIAEMLDEDLARAIVAFQSGNRDYARLTLRESMSYCIQCHTQAAGGPDFSGRSALAINTDNFSPLARGDYFAATRQFDDALKSYIAGVKDRQFAKDDLFAWEKAARSALALSVRYKESPTHAREVVKAIQGNSQTPPSLKDSARAWMQSIDKWEREKEPDSRLERADRLLKEAEKRASSATERGQDLLYLRASADLHQWLSTHPEPNAARAKALLMAGKAAEASRDMNFWTLHERYYEMCIHTLPNSVMARECYKYLEESVKLGYTGSSGVHMPREEADRLKSLRAKAMGENTKAK
ncbi:MAG TPA: hypothetical protein PLZ57_13195 [Pseudobdellovibrionaceae bacterium]|nr:hypothetical protein [Pseudobdellovibrionaceae bacterium]